MTVSLDRVRINEAGNSATFTLVLSDGACGEITLPLSHAESAARAVLNGGELVFRLDEASAVMMAVSLRRWQQNAAEH
ncbi:hypothetical protein [Streptomonospora salina]|uniref:Uncharacterized protein n=1 Tax=Streptomonospora salina TaxID=104205 RepID=A0A841EHD2_9ACTN|nr:hypothetical protein [Streptomonospora salina]MBB6000238.1 hypothetical protein [Streptomonospora salina]